MRAPGSLTPSNPVPTSSSSTVSAERDGKGLASVIERARDADIPLVIAVSSPHFADWNKFAGGMSVKLACDRSALETWWRNVSVRKAPVDRPGAANDS